jgi:hypothetical protein
MTDDGVYREIKIELSDSEWMSLIDGDRPGGLERCCANISELRDVLISTAREGGRVHMFQVERLRMTLGWVIDGHDIDSTAALVKVRAQLDLQGKPPHVAQTTETL